MSPQAFLAFANQSAARLQSIADGENRLLAAAAGQVLEARKARALGDAKLVQMHLRRGHDYYARAQQRDDLQVASAVAKIAAVRAEVSR
jgi:hypothetical protein